MGGISRYSRVREYLEKRGMVPSERKIAEDLKLHQADVHNILKKLEEIEHPLAVERRKRLKGGKGKPHNIGIIKSRKTGYLSSKELMVLNYIEKEKMIPKTIAETKKIAEDTGTSKAIVVTAINKLEKLEHQLVVEMRKRKSMDRLLYNLLMKDGERRDAITLRTGSPREKEQIRKKHEHMLESLI